MNRAVSAAFKFRLVGKVHPLAIRPLLGLRNTQWLRDPHIQAALKSAQLHLQFLARLEHFLVMGDVLVIPQRAGMPLSRARLANHLHIPLRLTAGHGDIRRRGWHIHAIHQPHHVRQIRRRKHTQSRPSTVVRSFLAIGQCAHRVFVRNQDAHHLPVRLQRDADRFARRLREFRIFHQLAIDKYIDGLWLHSSMIVQRSNLQRADIDRNNQSNINTSPFERSAPERSTPAHFR